MISFRKAEIDDVELLRSLAKEIWDSCYKEILSPEQIGYMLEMMYSSQVIFNEMGKGILWEIIESEQLPVGFISIAFHQNEAKLNKLYMKNEIQGRGIGQESLLHVMNVCRAKKVSRLELTVNKNNEKAVKAYERAGLKRIDSKIFDIGNGYVMDDFIYSCTL